MQGNRILFLDSLRAIAVLLVVWGHVMLVGINDVNTVQHWLPMVSEPIFGEDGVAKNPHGRLGLVVALATGINPGGLGVALFFLISGFVIVRSVENSTPMKFLIQRFFRIIPTCAVAVFVVAVVTSIACSLYGIDQPNSMRSIITSIFALNFYNGAFSTIPVLWTLEVEMTFYFIVAILMAIPGGIRPGGLFAASSGCLMFVAICASPAALAMPAYWVRILQHWSSIFVHISFMLIGALVYKIYAANGNRWEVFSFAVISIGFYWLGLNVLLSANSHREIGCSANDAVAALLIFIVGMFAGMSAKWLRPLRLIGDMSYPLYLLHVPLAWLFLYILSNAGMGMNTAGAISVILVIMLSWFMHKVIEMPSHRFGKRLATKFFHSKRLVENTTSPRLE